MVLQCTVASLRGNIFAVPKTSKECAQGFAPVNSRIKFLKGGIAVDKYYKFVNKIYKILQKWLIVPMKSHFCRHAGMLPERYRKVFPEAFDKNFRIADNDASRQENSN